VFLGVSGVVALAVYLVDKTPDYMLVCFYICPYGTACCRGGCCTV